MEPPGPRCPPGLWTALTRPLVIDRLSRWIKHTVLLLGPLLFFTRLTENPYSVQIALIEFGVGLLVILGIAGFLHRGEFIFNSTPLDTPLFVLTGTLLFSVGTAWFFHPPFFQPSVGAAGLKGLAFAGANAVGAYFVASQPSAPRERETIQKIIFIGTTWAACYGLSQFGGWDPVWGKLTPFGHRPISTYGNPNFLSTALVLVLPFGIHTVLTARSSMRAFFFGFVVVIHTATLIATLTRSSWLGALAGLAAYGATRPPSSPLEKKRIGVLSAAILLTVVVWPGWTGGRGVPVGSHALALWKGMAGDGIYASWHQRLLIWASALDLWRDAPWFGKGWGSFEIFYPFAQARWLALPALESLRTHANNAHQIFLEFAAQSGTIGLGMFLWTLVVGFSWAWRQRGTFRRPEAGPAVAGLAGVFGALIDNLFGNVSLFFAGPGLLVFWTLGQSVGNLHRDPHPVRRSIPSVAGAIVLGGVALFVIAQTTIRFAAEAAHFQGRRALDRGDLVGGTRALARADLWKNDVRFAFDLGNLHAEKAKESARQGLWLETTERSRAAVAAYNRAQRANPGYDEVPLNRAHQWELLGDPASAFRDRRYALVINPTHPETLSRILVDPLFERLTWGEKEVLFQTGLNFHPRSTLVWRRWAETLEKIGRRDEAAAAYERFWRLDLDDANAWSGVERNSPAGVGPVLKEARVLLRLLRNEPTDTPLRRARALARASVLRGLVPESPTAMLLQADLLALCGRPAEAEPLYRAVLSSTPSHEEARIKLARLRQTKTRPSDAPVPETPANTP